MGVRMYPNTRNVRNLEILASVAEGTYARLIEIRERHELELKELTDPYIRQQEGYRQWQEINADEDLAKMDYMNVFGWGKGYYPDAGVLNEHGYGQITDIAVVKQLFERWGFPAEWAELTEGLRWC